MAARRRRRRSAEQRLAEQVAQRLLRSPQGRGVLVVLLLLGALVYGGWWAWENYLRPRHPVGPTVRLATWNLRHFSDRPSTDLRAIAKIITSSNFDLVAIQEVKKDGIGVDRLLNVLGSPWRATSLSPMTGNSERFVFIYNGDHLQEIESARFINSPDNRVFDRIPYQAAFRAGQFDFTVITVHLSYTDTARRRREAEALARFAHDLAAVSSEKDVIVLGDFNEQGRGNIEFFEDNGWQSLNDDATNLSSSETYDVLLINPDRTGEWSGAAGAVRFDETLYGNNDATASEWVSDHRPAYADFVTNLPDDD